MKKVYIEQDNLSKFQKILFWFILIVATLSIISYLLNPYLSMVKIFQIEINHIYLILILIAVSLLNFLKKVKWGDKEIELKDYEEKKLPEEDVLYYAKDQQSNKTKKSALVSYKIASVLPNTIAFDFLKDWKVWFWIANHEEEKYRAYVKIKFISDGFEKEMTEGYYGGTQAWNLNAFSGIQAPGLGIPEEIQKKAKQNKKIEIRINCEIKDENDKLIEKKLPQGYVYDYKNSNWYLEP